MADPGEIIRFAQVRIHPGAASRTEAGGVTLPFEVEVRGKRHVGTAIWPAGTDGHPIVTGQAYAVLSNPANWQEALRQLAEIRRGG